MKSKREFQDEAKQLLENDPSKSLDVCLEMHTNYPSEFNNYIKHKTPQVILNSENLINSYLNIIKQKDISIDDKYPCPFSIILFNLIGAHSNNLFNANKIYEYCKKINPEYLSKKTSEFKDKEEKTKENPSDLETYYQYY